MRAHQLEDPARLAADRDHQKGDAEAPRQGDEEDTDLPDLHLLAALPGGSGPPTADVTSQSASSSAMPGKSSSIEPRTVP